MNLRDDEAWLRGTISTASMAGTTIPMISPPAMTDAIPPLPDLLARNLAAVFCGINPGLRAASSGHHFDGRGNRFWQVLHLAGLTPSRISPENDRDLLSHGYGLTTVVERPTAQASELTRNEFSEARASFEEKIGRYEPRWLAFLGKAAIAGLMERRDIDWGEQAATLAGARVWVLPNPSGLNRSFRLDDLVLRYAEFGRRIAGTTYPARSL
jgi:TDG/mug DNA glycosylase family protein